MAIEKMNENNFSCVRDVSCQGFGLLRMQLFGWHLFTFKKPFLDQASRGGRMQTSSHAHDTDLGLERKGMERQN